MAGLKKIWDFLLLIEKAIMIAASVGVVILIFISTIMRYILEKNFAGMEELVVMTAFWIYFIGGTYGSYEGSHITADVLSVFVKNEKTKEIIGFLRNLFTTVILFAASYCAVELMTYTMSTSAVTSVLKIPMGVVYAPICIGIIMMNFYTLVHTVSGFKNMFKSKREEVEI